MSINNAKLGTAVVERDHEVFFVMTPDGEVTCCRSTRDAQKHLRRWQQDRTPKDGIATMVIDWRDCAPPK